MYKYSGKIDRMILLLYSMLVLFFSKKKKKIFSFLELLEKKVSGPFRLEV